MNAFESLLIDAGEYKMIVRDIDCLFAVSKLLGKYITIILLNAFIPFREAASIFIDPLDGRSDRLSLKT